MNDVTNLDHHRAKKMTKVAVMTMPPPAPRPEGPFTVTVSDSSGKMFEATFPDYTGELPPDAMILGTCGCNEVLANLLAGALKTFLGAK